jgi:hypothetical protein
LLSLVVYIKDICHSRLNLRHQTLKQLVVKCDSPKTMVIGKYILHVLVIVKQSGQVSLLITECIRRLGHQPPWIQRINLMQNVSEPRLPRRPDAR